MTKNTDTRRNFVIFVLGIFLSAGCHQEKVFREDQVCFRGKCIGVEVVYKKEDVVHGLQGRDALPDNHGMLFVFSDAAVHSFWMKDTLIPLDMIWLDYSRRVVHIEDNVPPCQRDPCATYAPSRKAMYVLEVNARKAAQWGIKLGEEFEFRFKDLP